MIICPNCGATNDNTSKYCRKCGSSILNVSQPPKIRIPIVNANNESTSGAPQGNVLFASPQPSNIAENSKPAEDPSTNIAESASQTPKIVGEEKSWHPAPPSFFQSNQPLQEIPRVQSLEPTKIATSDESPFLQQIPAQPYVPQEIPTKTSSKAKKSKKTSKSKDEEELSSAMTNAMQSLAHSITDKNKTRRASQKDSVFQPEMKLSPSSINEILLNLSRLDQNIEATAVINNEGTILASALSERVSDSLFSTIGKTLTTIGLDVVMALNTGELKSITINGTLGKFSIAPIMTDTLLLLLAGPRTRAGIIHIAAAQAKKQFKNYLGIND